jgi:hypothetical protein
MNRSRIAVGIWINGPVTESERAWVSATRAKEMARLADARGIQGLIIH